MAARAGCGAAGHEAAVGGSRGREGEQASLPAENQGLKAGEEPGQAGAMTKA